MIPSAPTKRRLSTLRTRATCVPTRWRPRGRSRNGEITMRLYHSPGTRGTRVVWTLEEIGEPYELKIVTREDRGSEDHRQRHPLGRVPVIELDDGRAIFESAAICLHLADLHPDAGLIPELGTYERGLTYQWSIFAMAEVEKRVFG